VAEYLLDTSAMIAHYRKERGGHRVQELLLDDMAFITVSSLSIAEFARRLLELGADEERAREEALSYAQAVARIIPIDTSVAIRAFELGAAASTRLPLTDALIAACAATTGAILVHCDAHFDALPSWGPKRMSIVEG
jgi:predicted nucleic acid-binding protein